MKTPLTVACMLLASTAGWSACLPPYPDLDAWWSGDGNAADVYGRFNGALVGSAGYGAGQVGQAFDFNGGSDRVDLGAGSLGDFGDSAFSVAFWVRPDMLADNVYLLGRSVPDAGVGWDMRLFGDSLRVAGVDGWGFNITTGALFAPGNWHHVTLVAALDSGGPSDVRLYIDGVLAGSAARATISNSSNPMRLGHTTAFGGSAFNGRLDEVQVFARALDAAEVQALVAAPEGFCRPCARLPADRFGWWRAENNTLDDSGSADGLAGGNLAFSDGKVGRAFLVDGSGFVELPASTLWNLGTSSFTVTGWFQSSTPGYGNIVRHHDGGVADGTWGVRLTPGGQLEFLMADSSSGLVTIQSTSALNDGQWHALAAVRNAGSSELLLYVDGSPAANAVSAPGLNVVGNANFRMLIGAGGAGGGGIFEPFVGMIDEIAFHRRALAESEIQALANAAGVGVCLPIFADGFELAPPGQTAKGCKTD